MEFRDELKRARKALGLTQQEVADNLGITKSTYCGYETGKRLPDVPKIKALAKVLQVSGDILIGTATSSKNDDSLDEFTSDERKLLALYRQLNASGKDSVMATVRALAENPLLRSSEPTDENIREMIKAVSAPDEKEAHA